MSEENKAVFPKPSDPPIEWEKLGPVNQGPWRDLNGDEAKPSKEQP